MSSDSAGKGEIMSGIIRKAWDIDRFNKKTNVHNGVCGHGCCDRCLYGCFDDTKILEWKRKLQADTDIQALMEARRNNWIYEDDLPEDISKEKYDTWFSLSKVILGVRMGPKISQD